MNRALAVFVHSFAPAAPDAVVFGAIDFATAAVARAGKFLGHRVTKCDAGGILRQ